MATATFPEGISPDFDLGDSSSPIGEDFSSRIKRISDLFGRAEEKGKEPPDGF